MTIPMTTPRMSPRSQSRVPVNPSFSLESFTILTRMPRTSLNTTTIIIKERIIQAAWLMPDALDSIMSFDMLSLDPLNISGMA